MATIDERPAAPPITISVQIFRELVGMVGACFAGYGAWLHYPPAGFMVGGGILVGLAVVGTVRGDAAR
ncbi:hypothetical protein [Methylobacterium gnaphalii]|uniref:Uncharacterized protein n=1 Tax=Methylobacterium gnaphalii TaxID=1010610 RepID=A0A512JNY3_9HYPH|nr:hypothetical protein [Methylobacterium gnaphalii]GEP11667.1 hypothetical protein MGN01_35120 [Methylobacterium gnaphalii]GJD71357.1 hypothetical protein MMMDOFMJ_4313 [Methylobacterium gnaphalii]GLS50165.1 hypothetical protein GCM10007885_30170 [Methylobacterium gnaphalii]